MYIHPLVYTQSLEATCFKEKTDCCTKHTTGVDLDTTKDLVSFFESSFVCYGIFCFRYAPMTMIIYYQAEVYDKCVTSVRRAFRKYEYFERLISKCYSQRHPRYHDIHFYTVHCTVRKRVLKQPAIRRQLSRR